MKSKIILFVAVALTLGFLSFTNKTLSEEMKTGNSIYQFEATTIDGKKQSLSEYKGKVVLIVNVASKCGFTPQYEGLETLYNKYSEKGFVVLGFPCNQFGGQEPGDSDDIKEFCSVNYGVTFPMFEKVKVNGDEAHPLFKFLKEEKKGTLGSKSIKWNFTKFLVDRNGKVIERFSSSDKPIDLAEDIEKLL